MRKRNPLATSMTIISRYLGWNWNRCWKMAIQPDRLYNTDWNQPSNVNYRCVIQLITKAGPLFASFLYSQLLLPIFSSCWSRSFVYIHSFQVLPSTFTFLFTFSDRKKTCLFKSKLKGGVGDDSGKLSTKTLRIVKLKNKYTLSTLLPSSHLGTKQL